MELKSLNIQNKTILYRSPYDIDTQEIHGEYAVKDNSRIKATIPTLKYLLDQNCKIVILTWVERPQNGYEEKYSTKPHAKELSKLLNWPVKHIEDCIGPKVQQAISQMNPKDILMLENTRFYAEDENKDDNFAKKLTQGSELIVFDAFPQAHRESASIVGILNHLPSIMGFYMEEEYNNLSKLLNNVDHPFTIIMGGAKLEEKSETLINLGQNADNILIGGDIYSSQKELDELKKQLGDKMHIPTKLNKGKDITKETIDEYVEIIEKSKTVFWAGPMGMYEEEEFEGGTLAIAQAIAKVREKGGTSIVTGGDTVAALNKFSSPTLISHLSLAGGAALEFLSGKKLLAIQMLCT